MNKKKLVLYLVIISILLMIIFRYNQILINTLAILEEHTNNFIESDIYLSTIDYNKIFRENSLNSREQAFSIWIIIILVYMLVNNKLRESLMSLIKCVCNFKFTIITVTFIIYNVIIIIWLNKFGLWDISLIKDNIVWFIFSGLVIVFKSIGNNGKNNYFRNIILDNLKIVILLQFILSEYTMSFLFEFIGVPIFFLIGALLVIAENKSEYKDVKKVLVWIQNIMIMIIMYNSVKAAIIDINNLGTYNNLLKLIVPGVLSVLSIIPAYVLALYSSYETIFVRLNSYKGRSRRLSLYLKGRILLYCNINLKRVNSLWHDKNKELFYLTDKKEIKRILS